MKPTKENIINKNYKLIKDRFVNPIHTYELKNTLGNMTIHIYHEQSENRYSGYIYLYIKELELEDELETLQNYRSFEEASEATRKLLRKTIDQIKKKMDGIKKIENWYADNFHRI